MQTTTETTVIERELAIAARPETVWAFLVEPEKAGRWMGRALALDPRPGGEYRVEVLPGETAAGTFLEVEPPHRLVYSWGWAPGSTSSVPSGSSRIEIELIPDGDGTTLRFRHVGLPTAESVESHRHGWEHYLERLATAAAGGNPGRDTWLDGVS